jgi:HlyD family secretion protein
MEQFKPKLKEDLQVLRIDRSRVTRPEPHRQKWLVVVSIAGLLLLAVVIIGTRLTWNSQLGLAATPVRVVVVVRRGSDGPSPVLSAAGYIIARNRVEVASKITGRIVSLEVTEGDLVKPGQVIARLDDHEMTAQVRQAQANVEAAQARLAQLEAGSRRQEIDRAQAQMERANADSHNAQLNLQRTERLVNDGVLSQQALDDARARREIALKAYQAAAQDYELARLGPRQEEIDLARAQVQQAIAALAFAQAQLENTIIRAPVAGMILDRYVDVGDMVTTGFVSERGARQALVSLADLKDLQAQLDITEADIAKVELGQPTIITPDAYPDHHYRGLVEYIAGVADRQRATIQSKVKVLNPDALLRPDMGARVAFYPTGEGVPQREPAVMAPTAALVNQAGRTVVFLARDGRTVVAPVTVGREQAGYVEILSGLRGGESVIVGGQPSLKDGDRIRLEP